MKDNERAKPELPAPAPLKQTFTTVLVRTVAGDCMQPLIFAIRPLEPDFAETLKISAHQSALVRPLVALPVRTLTAGGATAIVSGTVMIFKLAIESALSDWKSLVDNYMRE